VNQNHNHYSLLESIAQGLNSYKMNPLREQQPIELQVFQ